MSENTLELLVEDVDAGQRADKFLSVMCDDMSRSQLKKLIGDGHVLHNGSPLKSASLKTEQGDAFSIKIPEPVACEALPENIPLDIVYEDDDLIVLNKAVGMVVHPGAGNWDGTLVNALLYHCGDSLSGIGGVMRPGIVHRLDKDTSGLMMVAKNDHAHQYLSDQLADRSLSRIYHALVLGVPLPIKASIDRPIGRHKHHRTKMSVMSNKPRDARTHYKVLESFGEGCALVECKLESGRTHQIRVHMEALGHPLIGDPLYGPQRTALISKIKNAGYSPDFIKELITVSRPMLHAHVIKFLHPKTEEEMIFTCDMPYDMSNALKTLTK